MTQYLLTPEQTQIDENSQDLDTSIPLGVLASRAIHMVNQYDVLSPQGESSLHSEITRKFNKNQSGLQEMNLSIKKQDKSKLPPNESTYEQLLETFRVVFDSMPTNRQIDYISQINYEETQSLEVYNLEKLLRIFSWKFAVKNGKSGEKELILNPATLLFQYYKEPIIQPLHFSNPSPFSLLRVKSPICPQVSRPLIPPAVHTVPEWKHACHLGKQKK